MKATTRPRLRPSIGPATRAARVLAIVITAIGAVAGLFAYPSVPTSIPIHWDATGTPDSWGPSWMMLILLATWVLLVGLLEWLMRIPHAFNYPREVTPDNAAQLYRVAVTMLAWLNLTMAVMFASLVAQSYGIDTGAITVIALIAIAAITIAGVIRTFTAASRG